VAREIVAEFHSTHTSRSRGGSNIFERAAAARAEKPGGGKSGADGASAAQGGSAADQDLFSQLIEQVRAREQARKRAHTGVGTCLQIVSGQDICYIYICMYVQDNIYSRVWGFGYVPPDRTQNLKLVNICCSLNPELVNRRASALPKP